jgi:hypothetical protein
LNKKLKTKKINLKLRRPKVGDDESLLTLFMSCGFANRYLWIVISWIGNWIEGRRRFFEKAKRIKSKIEIEKDKVKWSIPY